MTTGVFAMVLGAAVLHAAWNALVKVNADRFVMIAIMMLSQVAVALLVVPFVAFPTSESWPYIWASTALNTAYCVFLINAYRYGDLSHVYWHWYPLSGKRAWYSPCCLASSSSRSASTWRGWHPPASR